MAVALRVSSPRLVGRREELARLEALLDAARSGRPTTALVTGDAGIGKTRLAGELSGRAGALGVQVFTGRCVDVADDVMPFGPLVDLLDQIIRKHGVGRTLELAGPTADELVRLAPVLGSGGTTPQTNRASSTRLYLALSALVNGLASRKPLLLVIEDLHWVDRSTRDLLALLVANIRGPTMLLFTIRSDEVSSDTLLRFVAELERGGAVRVPLSGLDRSEQARQIAAIVGVPPTRELVDRIYGRAEGNPFFAEELLAFGDGDDLPSGVRDLVLSRLRSLPEDAIEITRIGALAGRRVSYGLLAATSGFAPARLDAAVRAAVEHHVLVGSGDGFAFRHALLREAIRTTVLPGQGTRLHARIAETLTERPDLGSTDGYGVAGRIARHWHQAGDLPRTLVTSLRAAAAAEDALAWPAALLNYERAISLLDEVPEGDTLVEEPRYRILWAAAETAHLSAQPSRAAQLVRDAIDAVDAADPGTDELALHHAYLHERLGRYLWMAADGVGALAAYERAVELAPRDHPTRWLAAIYSGYGQILMLLGRFRDSMGWCERAIGIARAVEGARSTEGHARNNLGVDLAYLGELDAGIAHLQAARTIAEEEFDDVDDIARAIVNLHTVLLDAGRLQEAAEVAIDGIGVVERLGLARRKGVWCRCDAADALLRLGRTDEARVLIEEAVELQPAGIDAARTAFLRGSLHLLAGDLDLADEHLSDARDRSDSILDDQLIGPLYRALVDRRRSDDPSEALELAAEGQGRLGDDTDASFCVPLHAAAVRAAAQIAVTAAGDGDQRGADRAIEQAERWLALARSAVDADPASKPEPLAHLQTATAERSRAEGSSSVDLWTRAGDSWERLGCPYWAAYCQIRLAEAHLHAGDRDAANTALLRSEAAASAIEARGLQAEIAALARRARLRVPDDDDDGPGTSGYQLTPREREVLELVAEGQTDRQIGERLFISHRTVERHVSNILAKLGAKTRTEATAIAHRERLVAIGG